MAGTDNRLSGINIFPSESVFKAHQNELADGDISIVPVDCESLRGKSAYQAAVERGFEGTEAEWLLALKGDKGDVGPIGPQGLSAYEVAVHNGFDGSETQWLESIRNTELANVKKRVITLIDDSISVKSDNDTVSYQIELENNAVYLIVYRMNGCIYQNYFTPISIPETGSERYFINFFYSTSYYNTCRMDVYKNKIVLNPVWSYKGFTFAEITHLWLLRIENDVYSDGTEVVTRTEVESVVQESLEGVEQRLGAI